MNPHRFFLLLAILLVPLTLVVVLLRFAEASSNLPVAEALRAPSVKETSVAIPIQKTLPFSTVIKLATAAELPNVMAAITQSMDPPTSSTTTTGLIWTTDGGRTWRPFATSPWSDTDRTVDVAVVQRTDPSQPIRFLVSNGAEIYRTGDFGLQWTLSITTTRNQPNDPSYRWFSCSWLSLLNGAQAQALYTEEVCWTFENPPWPSPPLSPWHNFYASDDGGVTWEQLIMPFNVYSLSGLLPSPIVSNRLYAGDIQDYGFGYVYTQHCCQSDDNGLTWQPRLSLQEIDVLVPDRSVPERMYGIDQVDSEEEPRRLYKVSIDHGATWHEWASRPCAMDDFISSLESTGSGQLWARCGESQEWNYSPDGSDTWRAMGAKDAHLLTADNGHPGHVLMVDDAGLWRSVNGGEWELLTADFSAPSMHYLPIVPQ